MGRLQRTTNMKLTTQVLKLNEPTSQTGRIYPKAVVQDAIDKATLPMQVDMTPDRLNVDLDTVVGQIDHIWIDENDQVMANFSNEGEYPIFEGIIEDGAIDLEPVGLGNVSKDHIVLNYQIIKMSWSLK